MRTQRNFSFVFFGFTVMGLTSRRRLGLWVLDSIPRTDGSKFVPEIFFMQSSVSTISLEVGDLVPLWSESTFVLYPIFGRVTLVSYWCPIEI